MKHLIRIALVRSCGPVIALAPTSILAQAPHITTQGDPSVLSDTIYKLAVKPAAQ